MRILYVTTIPSTMKFFISHFKMLVDEGHVVELACNCENIMPDSILELGFVIHNIPFSRAPLSKGNIHAIKKLKEVLVAGDYDIVHTHTPNASACVRLTCRKLRKRGLRVFYTAHGFHFYKGAPFKNWLIYYPVEWLCAHWTDKLITINQEDYALAQKRMHAKEVVYVPGVGIDLTKFDSVVVDRDEKRRELGVPANATLLVSIGELNDNKNHEAIVKAINGMDVYYIIAGAGGKRASLQELIDAQGITDRIKLLGYRSDVKELYAVADIYAFPSYREGLSVALMEAMASGLPCAVSRIRGNTDLIDEKGGYLFSPYDIAECKKAITKLIAGSRQDMGLYNREKVKNFSSETVLKRLEEVYKIQ